MTTIATDLDGTIYKGTKLIDGVKESYKYLINNNVDIFFITNNSSQTPYEIKEKLENLLSLEIDMSKIITPLNILESLFVDNSKKIYVYGSSSLKKYVESINQQITNIEQSDLILIGRKSKNEISQINLIKDFIQKGKEVLCLNKDLTFPSENQDLPGNGAVVKMIEEDLNIKIDSLGKPDKYYIQYCRSQNFNFDYVVGDRVDTDIFFGKEIKSKTILVETGIKNFESTEIADIKLKSFSEIIPCIF